MFRFFLLFLSFFLWLGARLMSLSGSLYWKGRQRGSLTAQYSLHSVLLIKGIQMEMVEHQVRPAAVHPDKATEAYSSQSFRYDNIFRVNDYLSSTITENDQ